MSLRKTKLLPGEIYHIYNRGVDKRNIFMDDEDRFRFIHNLFQFNNSQKIKNMGYFLKNTSEVGLPNIKKEDREMLVDILAYCLMDNHFHLMVRQKTDTGITEFMRKLGTGYTNYFNKKYKRNGSLFQGKFKSVNISNASHLLYLPIYIHLNPLDFKFHEWRKNEIKNIKESIEFLDSYRWSSYMDYTGKKNFPSLIEKSFLLNKTISEKDKKKEIINWIKSFNELNISEVMLD